MFNVYEKCLSPVNFLKYFQKNIEFKLELF